MNLAYYLLFTTSAVLPLIFTTQTTELFEIPKMFFVYFVTTALFAILLFTYLKNKYLTVPKNPMFLSFCIFSASSVASTLITNDFFTSFYGFPTRLNGGLLSQLAYLILFLCTLVLIKKVDAGRIITGIALGALAVSIWGIPSYFGYDPTCLVLTGKISPCWQQDFNPQLRIFSTLGQPNWLASYLTLTIPPTTYLILTAKTTGSKIFFSFATTASVFALFLTNSRSGLIALTISILFFLTLTGKKVIIENTKFLLPVLLTLIVFFFLFSDVLKNRITETFSAPQANSTQNPATETFTPTESGTIRLIVWRGAFDIFQNNPLFGTGPETFVSSYFEARPADHNQTSEWEFYYNKAHNEFLNHLANLGILGIFTYILFLLAIARGLFKKSTDQKTSLFLKATIASTIGYIITIFFGFSTTATQTIFILLISCAIILSSKNKEFKIQLDFLKNKLYAVSFTILAVIFCVYTITFFARLYIANYLEKQAVKTQSPSQELLYYKNAITSSPIDNPYLLADFANSIALYTAQVDNQQNKEILIRESLESTKRATSYATNNYLITQKTARTYLLLLEHNENLDKEAQKIAEKLTTLAPTYPPAYLLKAKIEISLGQPEMAIKSLNQALELKNNYLEARQLLAQLEAK